MNAYWKGLALVGGGVAAGVVAGYVAPPPAPRTTALAPGDPSAPAAASAATQAPTAPNAANLARGGAALAVGLGGLIALVWGVVVIVKKAAG